MSDRAANILANLVWPENQYARSTNIELDGRKAEGIPDFKFSSKSLRLLDDILDSSQGNRRDRAWSIIGPYGSGKSTFMLFLLQLLGGMSSPWLERCMVQLSLASPEIENKVNKEIKQKKVHYIPVVIQGSRIPLDLALCKSLHKAATDTNADTSWVSQSFITSLNITIETIEAGVSDSISTVELYRQAANLARIAGYQGLLVEVDEFGKFLERARWQGDLPDLITAQYLAELASSLSEPHIFFTVALHQGFQHYASTLSKQQWLEWAKIQGRFRQVDFNEEPENLYGLVAASLRFKDKSIHIRDALDTWVTRVWNQVNNLPAFKIGGQSNFWPDLLRRIYPLHPITLYALPRLSAHLGQNERTLFTFLASDDPLGFKAFLSKTCSDTKELPSLTADYLYDYFIAGSRFAWLPIDIQRKVSEIEAALERLGDRPPIETRLLKVIGVLSLLKTSSVLPASEEVLSAALDICDQGSKNSLKDAIRRLEVRKIIVFKRFAEEYRIWKGTDFDFELAQSKARDEIQMGFDLTTMMNTVLKCRPLLARRHSFENGTTRLFNVKLMNATDLLKMSNDNICEMIDDSNSDGMIIYVIPSTLEELSKLKLFAQNISDPRLLLVVPKEPVGINSLVLDLAALQKIPSDCPEIGDDDVAIKELASRIESTEDFLNESLSTITEPAEDASEWYWCGLRKRISNRRALNILLSEICDVVYSKAPSIRNELINRQFLSSSVVVAVKKILKGLLDSSGEARLGFVGNGPEISIFTAVLEEQHLYREDNNGLWGLYRPEEDTPTEIRDVWLEIERYLQSTNSTRSLESLYEILASPPYGLRKGLISLLIWIVLIYHRRVVSLYENGTYIKDWTIEIFDLFLRSPSTFTVRWLLLADSEGKLLQQLNDAIPEATHLIEVDGRVPLNGFLTSLYGWYSSLTDYSKNTERISPKARKFRTVLLTVTDPVEFICSVLPDALGLESVYSITEESKKVKGKYFAKYVRNYQTTIREIDKSYAVLVDRIVTYMTGIFGCPSTIPHLRQLFNNIEPDVMEHVTNSDAKAFLLRARQSSNNDTYWIESVTSVISGQPPKYWLDTSFHEFKDKFSTVVLSIEDARRRLYARNMFENSEHHVKRITIEDQGKLLLENHYSHEETIGEIEEVSHKLFNEINREYPDLPHRSKQLIIARVLELLTCRTNDE